MLNDVPRVIFNPAEDVYDTHVRDGFFVDLVYSCQIVHCGLQTRENFLSMLRETLEPEVMESQYSFLGG